MDVPNSKMNSSIWRQTASAILALPGRLVIGCIRIYQKTAPMRPPMCRYHPTCSEYAAQAIRKYGLFAGFALGVRRIVRCNTFTSGGYDPVP